mmetsp:Transcript_10134/g.18185  ORF Transcript_10134/g.18185 Transcript_10134/m.18185 type:complete len:278 (+) Transcript_10134:50-883(+)
MCSIHFLAYISFASTTTRSQVEQAAQTLLHLPILTTGLWGDGESSNVSLLKLATSSYEQSESKTSSCSLVIVPQANLISKVKQGGKSIQYHGQINKEKGDDLYDWFCECLKGQLLEVQFSDQCNNGKNAELPQWYKARRAFFEQQNNSKQALSPSTPPNQLFRDESKYSEWDERGIPTKDATEDRKPITKSQGKKLSKIYDAHCKRHDKWKKEQQQKHGEDDGSVVERGSSPKGPPPARWEDSLDPSFCQFVAGSFGKRQGLEFQSDMGPFVHSFQI